MLFVGLVELCSYMLSCNYTMFCLGDFRCCILRHYAFFYAILEQSATSIAASFRSNGQCICASTAVALGIGVAVALVIDLYCMLLIACNTEAESSIKRIALPVFANVGSIGIDRVSVHGVGSDDDIGIAS